IIRPANVFSISSSSVTVGHFGSGKASWSRATVTLYSSTPLLPARGFHPELLGSLACRQVALVPQVVGVPGGQMTKEELVIGLGCEHQAEAQDPTAWQVLHPQVFSDQVQGVALLALDRHVDEAKLLRPISVVG